MNRHVSLVIAFAVAVISCDSTTIDSTSGRPAFTAPINVPDQFIASNPSVLQVAAATADNLFDNNGFESSLRGWSACEDGSISLSPDARSGGAALLLNPKHCFFRTVAAEELEDYELTCHMKLISNQGWTGMGLSFLNDEFEQIDAAPNALATAPEYRDYTTGGLSPVEVSYASMWIYSENPVLVDDCSLAVADRPLSTVVDSNLVDIALINNPDFSEVDGNGQPLYWSVGCGGNTSVNDSLELGEGACVDQSFSTSDLDHFFQFSSGGSRIGFRCNLKNVSGYADMSVFFDGELFKSVELTNADVNTFVGFEFQLEHLPLNGFASLYAEGVLEVDDCEMFFF